MSKNTVWKSIKGYEGFYEVSNDKQVRRCSFIVEHADTRVTIHKRRHVKKREDETGKIYYPLSVPHMRPKRFYIDDEHSNYFEKKRKEKTYTDYLKQQEPVIGNINQFKNTQFIRGFRNIRTAYLYTGIPEIEISEALNKNAYAGGYKWRTKSNLKK